MAETDIDVAITLNDDINITLDVNGGVSTGDTVDSASVDAAGATMNTDTTLVGNGYFLDEDTMASNSASKVPSQQSVKAYTDNSIELAGTQPKLNGGIPYRPKNFTTWFDALENVNTTAIDVVTITDSIGEQGNTSTNRPWTWRLGDFLQRYTQGGSVEGYVPCNSGTSVKFDTTTSTNSGSGFGGHSGNHASGQYSEHTAYCDRVSVLYRISPSGLGATITIRDGGSGGTIIGTIDPYGADNWSNMWTSDDLGAGNHTIHISVSGGTGVYIEGAYFYNGNYDKGIRIWPANKSGLTSQLPDTTLSYARQFILDNQPKLILLCTGFNDYDNYDTYMRSLVTTIKAAAPNSTVALWIPYILPTQGTRWDKTKVEQARAIADDFGLGIIDASIGIPEMGIDEYNLLSDSTHPNAEGNRRLAVHFLSVLAGDPIGSVMNMSEDNPLYVKKDGREGGQSVYGGTATTDNLTLYANAATYDSDNTGRIKLGAGQRLVADGSFNIDANNTGFWTEWYFNQIELSGTKTVGASGNLGIYSAFKDTSTIKTTAQQALSSNSLIWAGVTSEPTPSGNTTDVLTDTMMFFANPTFAPNIAGAHTYTGVNYGGFRSAPTISIKSGSHASAASVMPTVYGYVASASVNSQATITNYYGYWGATPSIGGTGVLTNAYGFKQDSITAGTNRYGVRIDSPSATGATAYQTLWVGGDTNSTDANHGIAFGSSRDTNLYRSAANTLKTDDQFIARIQPRVTTITSSATPTINTDNCDAVTITALATAITSMTTNLTGTPNNFDELIIRIKDNGTARAITWGSSFEAKGVALPTTTVISKVLTVAFIYDSVTSKWGCVGSAQEA